MCDILPLMKIASNGPSANRTPTSSKIHLPIPSRPETLRFIVVFGWLRWFPFHPHAKLLARDLRTADDSGIFSVSEPFTLEREPPKRGDPAQFSWAPPCMLAMLLALYFFFSETKDLKFSSIGAELCLGKKVMLWHVALDMIDVFLCFCVCVFIFVVSALVFACVCV